MLQVLLYLIQAAWGRVERELVRPSEDWVSRFFFALNCRLPLLFLATTPRNERGNRHPRSNHRLRPGEAKPLPTTGTPVAFRLPLRPSRAGT